MPPRPALPKGVEHDDGMAYAMSVGCSLRPGDCYPGEEDIILLVWVMQEGHRHGMRFARRRFVSNGLFIKSSSVLALTAGSVAQRVVMTACIRALLGIRL